MKKTEMILKQKITIKLKIKSKISKYVKEFKKQKYLLIMSLPFIIWLIIFKYVPLWGWSIAFRDYKPGISMFDQQWVGFKYFIEMFKDDGFYLAMRNTIVMSILALVFTFLTQITLAIILNEIRHIIFKRTIQTISYLPHFVSWVVVSSIFGRLLSSDGTVNNILMGLHIIKEPIQFMAKPNLFWGIITSAEIWKEIGWGSIIFLAAVTTISPDLYEAAIIDGANRFRKIWHITLPGIMPVVMVILIMSIGNLINTGFEKQYLMRNSLVRDYAEVIDLFIFDYGINVGRLAYGTAAGIFKSVISIILLVIANTIIKKTMDVKVY